MDKRLKDCNIKTEDGNEKCYTIIEGGIEKEWVEEINKIFVFYWC